MPGKREVSRGITAVPVWITATKEEFLPLSTLQILWKGTVTLWDLEQQNLQGSWGDIPKLTEFVCTGNGEVNLIPHPNTYCRENTEALN